MSRVVLVGTLLGALSLIAGCSRSLVLSADERHDAGRPVSDARVEAYPLCTSSNTSMCPNGAMAYSLEDRCADACQCRRACETLLDCPIPWTGTADPQCVDGNCVLRCDSRFACPSGMQCTESPSGGRYCMWVSERRDCEG